MYNHLQENKGVNSSVRRFTPINIHKDEPEALRVRDTVAKERASEEYKNHDMT